MWILIGLISYQIIKLQVHLSILDGFKELLEALAATDETNASIAQKVSSGVRSDCNGMAVLP